MALVPASLLDFRHMKGHISFNLGKYKPECNGLSQRQWGFCYDCLFTVFEVGFLFLEFCLVMVL